MLFQSHHCLSSSSLWVSLKPGKLGQYRCSGSLDGSPVFHDKRFELIVEYRKKCKYNFMFLKDEANAIWVNSLAPRRFQWNLRKTIFKLLLVTDGYDISREIALRWTIWANVDPDPCRHMTSLGHNELTPIFAMWGFWAVVPQYYGTNSLPCADIYLWWVSCHLYIP